MIQHSTLPRICLRDTSTYAHQKQNKVKQNMAKEVHGSFIHNTTNLETIQMSIKSRMENKLWHIHTMEYATAMKKKQLLIFAEHD